MQRYTVIPLPPYAYVPGYAPHPVSDPAGHRFGQPEPRVDAFDPAQWRGCSAYLYGIDLFNQGFYWEAHEQWEAIWIGVGRRGPVADFLKALIKLAAAGVKLRQNRADGLRRHAARASQLFCGAAAGAGPHRLCGLAPGELGAEAQAIANTAHTLASAGSGSGHLERRLPITLTLVEECE